MSRLIDADKLKAHYSWWKGGTREMTMDEAKNDFDTIIDLQPTVEAEPIVIDGEEYLTGADYNAYLKGYKDGRAEPNTAIETVNWYHQNAEGEMVLGANSNQQAWFKADDVFKALKAEPTKHGRWINIKISTTGESSAECSECGAIVHTTFTSTVNYCPKCGARMDGGENG